MKTQEYYGIVSFILDDNSDRISVLKENQELIEKLGKCKLFFVEKIENIKSARDWKIECKGGCVIYSDAFTDKPVVLFNP